jgi:hypothetical protein
MEGSKIPRSTASTTERTKTDNSDLLSKKRARAMRSLKYQPQEKRYYRIYYSMRLWYFITSSSEWENSNGQQGQDQDQDQDQDQGTHKNLTGTIKPQKLVRIQSRHDVASHSFLCLLLRLRRVILQDAALFLAYGARNHILNSAPFTSKEFEIFQSKLIKKTSLAAGLRPWEARSDQQSNPFLSITSLKSLHFYAFTFWKSFQFLPLKYNSFNLFLKSLTVILKRLSINHQPFLI